MNFSSFHFQIPNNGDSDVQVALALVHIQENDYASALQCFQLAVKLNPGR